MLPGLGVYDPMIGSLCSKIENNNHLSLAEARTGLSLAIMSKNFGIWIYQLILRVSEELVIGL